MLNLDTMPSIAHNRTSGVIGNTHPPEHQSRRSALDSEDSDLEHVPRIFRYGRFWVIFSLAMMSFILAVLFVSMIREPKCPSSCQTSDCSEQVTESNGEVHFKVKDCTCQDDVGQVYCTNKRQTSEDNTLSVVSTLFFVLFILIVLISCCLARCSHNYDERRVGTDPHEMQIIYPTQANITTSPTSVDVYNAGIATTSNNSVENFSYCELDNIPTATIARKSNVPVAIAVPL